MRYLPPQSFAGLRMKLLNSSAVNQGTVLALLSYCASSIIMTLTNKLVLSQYAFHLNFLLLGIQSLVTIILLRFFASMDMLTHVPYNPQTARIWFPVSLALVAMIYTGSKALQYLSIPLVTIFKNVTIIIIAYVERYVYHGAPVTSLMLLAFGMMLSSSVVAAYSDITQGRLLKDSAQDISPVIPYFWMFANCLTTAFYALTMRAKIKLVGFQDFDTVYYNNILSIPVLFVFSLLVEFKGFFKFYDDHLAPGTQNSGYLWGLSMGILVSSVSAFAISYATSWSMRVTSSTTYSMVGALNKLPIAVVGMLFFSDPVTLVGIFSLLLAFFAGILYSYAKSLKSSSTPLPVYQKLEQQDEVVDLKTSTLQKN